MKILLLCAFFLLSLCCHSQSKPPYNNKLKKLFGVCYDYVHEGKYDPALDCLKELLESRRKKGPVNDFALTLKFIGDVYTHKQDTANSLRYWLEYLPYSTAAHGSVDMDLHNNIGHVYWKQGKNDSALYHYTVTLEAAKVAKNINYEANSSYNVGWMKELTDVAAAEPHYVRAVELYEQLGSKDEQAVILNQLALGCIRRSEYAKALMYAKKAEKLIPGLKNKKIVTDIYNTISVAHVASLDSRDGLDNLLKAKDKAEKERDVRSQAVIMGNIGFAYISLKQYDSARPYFQQSLDMSRKISFYEQEVSAMIGLGQVYTNLHANTTALEWLEKSLRMGQQYQFDMLVLKAKAAMGILYMQMAEDPANRPDSLKTLSKDLLLKRSLSLLSTGLTSAKKTGDIQFTQENYRLLSEAQAMNGDTGSAYINFKKYLVYRDSIYNYESGKKTEQVKQAEEKEALAIRRSRLINTGIIIGSLFILILGRLFFLRKIEKIRHKEEVTAVRQEALNAQISDHFIGNTFDSINYFIRSNDKEKASEYLGIFSKMVRKVMENASLKMVSIREDLSLLEDYMTLEKLRYIKEPLEYNVSIDPAIDIENTIMPPMIFQVLVENSIKHGITKTKGGTIRLSITRKAEMIECRVEDNGAGRSATKEVSARKSMGTALAQRLIKTAGRQTAFEIIDLVNDNQQPAGTAVIFTLPYTTKE